MVKAIQVQIGTPETEPVLRYVKNAGFTAVSAGFGSSAAFFAGDDWENRTYALKEELDALGLACVQTHLPCYDLLLSSEKTDPVTEHCIKRAITAAGILGAKSCAFHCRSASDHDFDDERALSDNLRALEDYLPFAQASDVVIAVENLPDFPGAPQWSLFSRRVSHILALVDHFHDPHVGVCWDFGHAHLTKMDQAACLKEIGSRLVCTHIHNNFEREDDHLAPSNGTMDFRPLMRTLKEIGYKGPLTLEVNYGYEGRTTLCENSGLNRFAQSYIRHCFDCIGILADMMEEDVK